MNVKERFLRYVSFGTASAENTDRFPSTEGQLVLADYLAAELQAMGVSDAARDENGYVYGHIEATAGMESAPAIGLIAHMDTSSDAPGEGIRPQTVRFDGENLPMIDDSYRGEEMIVTDGTTLLGADDKAGVAEIVTACEQILAEQRPHGRICLGFTPDEEIGCGADRFDFARFGADFAYTVDGGELGGIEYENFNAAAVDLTVHGLNTHPGSAKNKMRNAVLYLAEFMSLLPPAETPAHTEGREGFYHVADIQGSESLATLHMLIRDHDRERFEQRKRFVSDTVVFLNRKYGDGTFEVRIADSYYNMREIIEQHMEIVHRAERAMNACGVQPFVTPIRGGTDGARLSFEGLPCPNLSTGGLNFHSVCEAIPVRALNKMVEVLTAIVTENP